jgi:hypothetical protein
LTLVIAKNRQRQLVFVHFCAINCFFFPCCGFLNKLFRFFELTHLKRRKQVFPSREREIVRGASLRTSNCGMYANSRQVSSDPLFVVVKGMRKE